MATLAQATLSALERRVLERWIERVKAELDVQSLWLFGSRARGEEPGPESDVDLLVVTHGDRRRDSERISVLLDEVAMELGENPARFAAHVWDPLWLASRRSIDSFFMREVDRDKVVLLGCP